MFLLDILPYIHKQHQLHRKIVLATGVFDLIHAEHLKFLSKAKKAGDILILGIEADKRVAHLKGPTRPINSQLLRLAKLQQLNIADAIFILPEDFSTPQAHDQLIQQIRPAILAVSSHSPHIDKKSLILKKYGGQVVVVHQHNPTISTTLLIEQLENDK